jgi:hypothetical protein
MSGGELRSCPFCKSDNNRHYAKDPDGGGEIEFFVCDTCMAVISFGPRLVGAAAVDAYNRRASDDIRTVGPESRNVPSEWIHMRVIHQDGRVVDGYCTPQLAESMLQLPLEPPT